MKPNQNKTSKSPKKAPPRSYGGKRSPAAKQPLDTPKTSLKESRSLKNIPDGGADKSASGVGTKGAKTEKAYKLLAIQEGISAGKAKELIDRGLVSSAGRRVMIARAEMPVATTFTLQMPKKAKIIFGNENLLVLDKPAFMDSEELAEQYALPLLHRLDRETSGVLMLVKNDEYRQKAIDEFKACKVTKEYIALVEGKLCEECTIDLPIATVKSGFAKSRISKTGKPAITTVTPLEISGKISKVLVRIETGRTHQIRVHLAHLGHPIVGDRMYGSTKESKRIMLHASKVELLGHTFISEEPEEFRNIH